MSARIGPDTFETIMLVLFSVIGAIYIMVWAKEYLQAFMSRHRGETLLQTVQRAEQERELSRKATAEMLGSRKATFMSLVVNVGYGLLLYQSLRVSTWLFWALIAYAGLGFWLTRSVCVEKLPHWGRLSISNRFWVRWAHANLWPIHLFVRAAPKSDDRD